MQANRFALAFIPLSDDLFSGAETQE